MRCTKPSTLIKINSGSEEKWCFYSPTPMLGLELFLLLQQIQNETPQELQENHCLLVAVKMEISNKIWKFLKIQVSFKLYIAITIHQVPQQGYIPATETDFWRSSNHPFAGRESRMNWELRFSHIITNIPTASQLGLLQHERGLRNIQTLDNKKSPHCFITVDIQGFQSYLSHLPAFSL